MGSLSIPGARFPTRFANRRNRNQAKPANHKTTTLQLETLLDRAFKMEHQLQQLVDEVSGAGRRDGIQEILGCYRAANMRAESIFRSLDG
jgi:hypothetical protein